MKERLLHASYYSDVYRSHLLPSLGIVMSSTALDAPQRVEAIKYFADGSLALAAAGSEWSSALSRHFVCQRKARQQQKQQKQMLLRTSTSSVQRSVVLFKRKRSSRIRFPRARSSRSRSSSRMQQQSFSGAPLKERVRELQDLVPGGRQMKSSRLLIQEALDYAMFLELQVGVLASFLAAAATS